MKNTMNYKLKVSMNKYTLCFNIQCISKSIYLFMKIDMKLKD